MRYMKFCVRSHTEKCSGNSRDLVNKKSLRPSWGFFFIPIKIWLCTSKLAIRWEARFIYQRKPFILKVKKHNYKSSLSNVINFFFRQFFIRSRSCTYRKPISLANLLERTYKKFFPLLVNGIHWWYNNLTLIHGFKNA